MGRCLYLHIGMHKTGSTAVQIALNGYDDGNTAYLDLGHPNHSYYMAMLFCPPEAALELTRSARIATTPDSLQQEKERVRLRILEKIESGCPNLIFSGEELWLPRFDEEALERIKHFFAPHFDEIRVIVYIREPYAFMRSAIQEIVKTHCKPLCPGSYPEYRERLSLWEQVFGRDAIEYVRFAPDTLAGKDIVRDFAGRVGVQLEAAETIRVNASVSAEYFAALFWLRRYPFLVRLLLPEARMRAVVRRSSEFGRLKFSIAESVWASQVAEHAEDIVWVEERLGQPLAPEPAPQNAVVFRSEGDVLAFAGQHRGAFLKWSRQIMPTRKVVMRRVREVLRRAQRKRDLPRFGFTTARLSSTSARETRSEHRCPKT